MSTADLFAPTAAPSAPDRRAGLAALLRHAAGAVFRDILIGRTASSLNRLDDRTLADIGIDRSRIREIATAVVDRPHTDPRKAQR